MTEYIGHYDENGRMCFGQGCHEAPAAGPMSKHTPGPWTFRTAYSRGEPTGYVVQAGAVPIADVLGNNPAQEANARLVASSPALLEGAKMLLASLAWEEERSSTTYNGADTLRAAVTLAEGRA